MTLISLNVNIPRYILERALGQADLGIFASLAYLLVAISVVINALGQSVSSRLARMFAAGELAQFRAILRKLLGFGVLVLVAGVPAAHLLGRPLLAFIYRPEYGEHVHLFVMMVAIAGVSSISSFMGYANAAARNFRLQVPVISSTTAATVLFSFLLIPRFGMIGAAVVTSLSYLLNASLYIYGYSRSSSLTARSMILLRSSDLAWYRRLLLGERRG
jgi:O-antigen/teichoic acid export membrane protein